MDLMPFPTRAVSPNWSSITWGRSGHIDVGFRGMTVLSHLSSMDGPSGCIVLQPNGSCVLEEGMWALVLSASTCVEFCMPRRMQAEAWLRSSYNEKLFMGQRKST